MGRPEEHIEPNKTQGTVVKLICAECTKRTNHVVFVSADLWGSEEDEDGFPISWENNYQVVRCQGCGDISFRHLSWFSEDEDLQVGASGHTERLYPKRDVNTLKMRDFLNVPTNLRRIYRESMESCNNDCFTLCAAGLRTLVEGICADQSIVNGPVERPASGGGKRIIRKNTLEGKISGLGEKGVLTKPETEALHGHRFLGNDAVHQLAQPSFDELKLAIEIIEHVLEQLYEIPVKADELKRRRMRRNAGE